MFVEKCNRFFNEILEDMDKNIINLDFGSVGDDGKQSETEPLTRDQFYIMFGVRGYLTEWKNSNYCYSNTKDWLENKLMSIITELEGIATTKSKKARTDYLDKKIKSLSQMSG